LSRERTSQRGEDSSRLRATTPSASRLRAFAFATSSACTLGETFRKMHAMAIHRHRRFRSRVAHACSVDRSPSTMSMRRAHRPPDRRSPVANLPLGRLAEAVPLPGSGVTLPLDLRTIAARCTNAYHAPRRFAAVQFAFNNPRCRVLIFRKPQARFLTTTTQTSNRFWCACLQTPDGSSAQVSASLVPHACAP